MPGRRRSRQSVQNVKTEVSESTVDNTSAEVITDERITQDVDISFDTATLMDILQNAEKYAPATVSVSGGITEPTKPYGNVKVDVFISRPCKNTQEDIDATYKQISEDLEEKICQELDKAIGDQNQ